MVIKLLFTHKYSYYYYEKLFFSLWRLGHLKFKSERRKNFSLSRFSSGILEKWIRSLDPTSTGVTREPQNVRHIAIYHNNYSYRQKSKYSATRSIHPMTEIEFRTLRQICKTYNIPRCLPSACNNETTGNYQPATVREFKKGKKGKHTENAPPLNRILRSEQEREGEPKCPNNNSDGLGPSSP